jgi:dienelactone hydrolase
MRSHRLLRALPAVAVAVGAVLGWTAPANAAADVTPTTCTRVPPPKATTTKADDDAAAKAADAQRKADLKAAHPDRQLSAYSNSNQIGEGWRYRWRGGSMRYVSFTNRDGALLSGTAFAPDPRRCAGPRPAVLIAEGITANEVLYWWAAQALAEAGYTVLTFDYQNQGLSEANGHDPATGAPLPQVCGSGTCSRGQDPATGFLMDAQDALDFLLSTPSKPYAHAVDGEHSFPFAGQVDPTRVGLAGHSEGARIVSVLQGIDTRIDAVVAWDNLATTLKGDGGSSNSQCTDGGTGIDRTPATPRVPALGQAAPNNTLCMDPELKKIAYEAWRARQLPAVEVVLANTAHGADWAPTPTAPATNPWGTELASWYTIAWFDRWILGDVGANNRLYTKSFSLFDHYAGPLSTTSVAALDATFTSSADTGDGRCADLRVGCAVPPTTSVAGLIVAPTTTSLADAVTKPDRSQRAPLAGSGQVASALPPTVPTVTAQPASPEVAADAAAPAGEAPVVVAEQAAPVTAQTVASTRVAAQVRSAPLAFLALPAAGLLAGIALLVARRRPPPAVGPS